MEGRLPATSRRAGSSHPLLRSHAALDGVGHTNAKEERHKCPLEEESAESRFMNLDEDRSYSYSCPTTHL